MSLDRQTTLTQAHTPPGSSGDAPPPLGGRYEVLEQVGRGGMGVVFKARHTVLDRLVALKLTLPGASVERFKREARLLAQVKSPRVVSVHDFEELPDGRHLLVIEWVDGTDLAKRIKAGPLAEADALPLMRAVAEGMAAAADAGITHRDLKPSNILLDGRGARVCDFGLASSADLTQLVLTASGVMGTPHYMAPEQAESPRLADTRADVYAFGATFYHTLCGVPPFDAESVFGVLFKHKTEPLVAPQARVSGLSDRTAAVIERCLAKNPADRFQSFAEVLRHLQPEPAAADPWVEDDVRLKPHLARYAERRPLYVARSRELCEPDRYEFAGGRLLTIGYGDISLQDTEVVVCGDDTGLGVTGNSSRAVRRAAGEADIAAQLAKYRTVREGRVVVTSGGELPARFIFHAAAFVKTSDGGMNWPTRDLLREICHSCVYHADTLNVASLATSIPGVGRGRLDIGIGFDTLFQFWARTLLGGATALREVRVVFFESQPAQTAQ